MPALIIGTIFVALFTIYSIWEIITIKEVTIWNHRIEIMEKILWMLFTTALVWYYCR